MTHDVAEKCYLLGINKQEVIKRMTVSLLMSGTIHTLLSRAFEYWEALELNS